MAVTHPSYSNQRKQILAHPLCSIRKPSSPGTPVASAKLLTPFKVLRPPMCVGKNYREHVKEVDSWKGPGITQPSVPTVSALCGTILSSCVESTLSAPFILLLFFPSCLRLLSFVADLYSVCPLCLLFRHERYLRFLSFLLVVFRFCLSPPSRERL